MSIPKQDVEKRWTKGSGPGGQNKNKLETCCVLTHIPTGLTAKGDERTRRESYRHAYKALCDKVQGLRDAVRAHAKKEKREAAIRDTTRVRTYDYSRGVVTDHRTGKTASLKNVVEKGRLDLLR